MIYLFDNRLQVSVNFAGKNSLDTSYVPKNT